MTGVRPTDESGERGGGEGGGRPSLSPRQAQILDLAATGLSDKEIAHRLHVTHRTVRTHFENLFRDHGIRNRSQAIAVWSGRRTAGRLRPADECPYPKPFPPNFTECPAFQATQMVTLDISHRPLGSVLTCRHLESRLVPNTDYRWYGACVIGDAEARRRWSNDVGPTRLHEISTLRQEVSALSGPYVQRLMELRVAAFQQGVAGPTDDMKIVVAQFMRDMTSLLQERRAVLDHLHLPLEACLRLVRLAVDRFVDQGLTETDWEVPDEVLRLFPDDVRSYFRPRRTSGGPPEPEPTDAPANGESIA